MSEIIVTRKWHEPVTIKWTKDGVVISQSDGLDTNHIEMTTKQANDVLDVLKEVLDAGA